MAESPSPLLPTDSLLFLHIPKAAGTSLNTVLDEQFAQDEILELPSWADLPSVATDLTRPRFFRGHVFYDVHKAIPKKLRVVTLLRDPIERTISNLEMMRRNPADPWHAVVTSAALGDFLRSPEGRELFENTQTRLIGSNWEISRFADIASTTERIPEGVLEIAKQRLERFDCVGVVERFDDSVDLLCHTFGWYPQTQVAQQNVAPRDRLAAQALEPDVFALLHQLTELDRELHRFAGELLERRLTAMRRDLLQRCWRAGQTASLDTTVDLDFRVALPGTGWHPREVHPDHGWFRWSGPATRSSVIMRLPSARPVRLTFRLIAAASAEIAASLSVLANGVPVRLTYAPDRTGAQLYQGVLPDDALRSGPGSVELTWSVLRTVRPNTWDPGNTDPRSLGIALNQVQLVGGLFR